jgi:uncharacterized coiled-coil DUF342 family protein
VKRGFEENIPKVRPRVRLGRGLEDSIAALGEEPEGGGSHGPEARAPGLQLHSSEPDVDDSAAQVHDAPRSNAGPPLTAGNGASVSAPQISRAAPRASGAASTASSASSDDEAQARRERLAQVRTRAAAAAEPMPGASVAPPPAAEDAGVGKRARRGVQQVTALAKELSAELELAVEANGRLKVDLDGALTALRRAAEEAREHDGERERLTAEVDKRTSAARELLTELELLEAERDGALGQVARFSRELRETRARADEQARAHERQKLELDDARGQLRRLAAELEARVAERDAARSELQRVRGEKDELSEALLAARAEADDALESRSALEEIERALGEARTRVAGLR